jgi:glycosyltransferase involved in cell wall biosynthesis
MITIVMPTYNQGKFIAEAIDSILAQTFTDFELINHSQIRGIN